MSLEVCLRDNNLSIQHSGDTQWLLVVCCPTLHVLMVVVCNLKTKGKSAVFTMKCERIIATGNW